jgi:Ca2+-binding EF-hand superfamily protein
LALGAGGVAFAQTSTDKATHKEVKERRADNRPEWEKQFKAADKNGDGGLSKDEATAAKGFGQVKKNFDAMDTNHDGKVTIAEHDAWQTQQKAAKQAAKTSK